MKYFSEVSQWTISESAWRASFDEMAIDGRRGVEGIALWLGQRRDGVATISHVVALRGRGIRKQRYLLQIDPVLFGDVTDIVMERKLVLVGQIHAHAPECAVDLSMADRQYGFTVPHFLSIVAPNFALTQNTKLADCGVHVFKPGLGYRRLTPVELVQSVRLTHGCDSELIVVGGKS